MKTKIPSPTKLPITIPAIAPAERPELGLGVGVFAHVHELGLEGVKPVNAHSLILKAAMRSLYGAT